DRLKRAEKSRPELEGARKRLVETARKVEHTAGAAAASESDQAGPAAAGDRVEITHLGLKGDVLGVDGETVTVQAGAVTVKVPMQALRVVSRGPSPEGETYPQPRRGKGAGAGSGGRISTPGKSAVAVEINIIGRTTDEARDLVEKYLDDAFLAGL